MSEPTEEGLKRYPGSAGYCLETIEAVPCTCKPNCAARCAGECGCEACAIQFSAFCSDAGFHDAVPTSEEEGKALQAYRAGL